MKESKIEHMELIELLCILLILAEVSKKPTPIDEFKDLSFKDVLN